MSLAGLLLAAGAGTRMGRPKALVGDHGGPWLTRGVETLTAGGCSTVTVVLGAGAEDAVPLLDGLGVDLVLAADWTEGMSASLRAGLRSLARSEATGCLVHLVDLPDVTPDVIARLVAAGPDAPDLLARATYDGRPGHPVLLGRDHWAGVLETLTGDEGARAYLSAHPTTAVECGDLASGHDVDRLP